VAAAERGRTGERYILSHLNMPYRDIMAALARAAGKNPPRIGIPGWLMRIAARLVDVGRALRLPIPATGNQLRLSARDLYYDGGKAARALHAPEIGAETLADTVKWYVERGMIG
jgi:dihydroflavonol-4-reductase